MIEINGKVYRNIQEQVEKNKDDIADIIERGGKGYSAGTNIVITEGDETDSISTSNQPTFSNIVVTPGYGYIHTTYGPSTISMSIPRTPGYTLNIPAKDGTLATKDDFPAHLYLHHIRVSENRSLYPYIAFIDVYSTSSTKISTFQWLLDLLVPDQTASTYWVINCTGSVKDSEAIYPLNNISWTQGENPHLSIGFIIDNDGLQSMSTSILSTASIIDNVTQIY